MKCICFPNSIILTETSKKVDVRLCTNWWRSQSVIAGPKVQTGVLRNTSIIPVIKSQMIRIDIAFLSKQRGNKTADYLLLDATFCFGLKKSGAIG